MHNVVYHPDVQTLLRLLQKAQTHGDWEIVSHDATFKVLFSIIGKEPMAQREDEYRALHTTAGKTGAVPGAVALPSEGKQHVRTSIEEILPEPCRATILWVFSGNPSTMLGCTDVFPNLKLVAEDPLHLALRIEHCFSRKRVALSRLPLDLHRKFRAPQETEENTGEQPAMGVGGTWTNVVQYRDHSLRADWDNYCATPFRSHQEYIDELTKIAEAHPEEMERVGTDKRTASASSDPSGGSSLSECVNNFMVALRSNFSSTADTSSASRCPQPHHLAHSDHQTNPHVRRATLWNAHRWCDP